MIVRMQTCTYRREWLVALSAYALLVAPFGCQVQNLLLNTTDSSDGATGLTTSSSGLFLNSDPNDPLLASGRDVRGDAFFVFGTRDTQGGLADIDSILVQSSDGRSSFIAFEQGRPVHAEGPDGSYAHITYEELAATRLLATLELYDAETKEKSQYQIDVDLERTAQQVADLVQSVTGQRLTSPAVTAGTSLTKSDGRSVRITIFSPLFALLVIPLVLAVQLTIIILGQMLAAVFAVVALVLQATLLAVFFPLFLIGDILNSVLVRIEFIPLLDVFDLLPRPPVIVLL